MDIKFKPAVPNGYKRFKCDKCGCQFIKRVKSVVAECIKCRWGLLAVGYNSQKVDTYAKMKLYWLRNPKAWEDNIKRRTTQNLEGGNKKQTYLNDSFGNRLGIMPEAIDI